MRRRTFTASLAAALLGHASHLRASTTVATLDDYRALVCVSLAGGNDAFNMVVPRSLAEYEVYARARQNLALPRDSLLSIFPDNAIEGHFGLHASMPELRDLFARGEASIVAGIGPLIEPVTRERYLSGGVALPPQLFSHNDQQSQWQTLRGRTSTTTGWAGRIADLLQPALDVQRLPVNVSTSGVVELQTGSRTLAYTLGANGAESFGALSPEAALGADRRTLFMDYLRAGFDNVHARAVADVYERMLNTADVVTAALRRVPQLATQFPASPLGSQFAIVARMIAAREQLAVRRQFFAVTASGFDTHDRQPAEQPRLFGDLSRCLDAFQRAMHEIGTQEQVVTFTQSEFGRTLTSNGDGTDHGWSSHQLVVGGPVRGRRVVGSMPRLEIGGPDDTRDGRLIPTLSVDQYVATLARWFGVAEEDLLTVAPNLSNFAERDLGLLG